jgi:sialic acid synthase SpsE
MYGSDQASSIEPIGFLQLCGAVRKINSSLGDGVKRITAEELEVRKKMRGY